MWAVFNTLASNLGMTFGGVVTILFTVASIIFMAKDFTIGMFMFILTQAGIFIWFYQAGLNYAVPLILFFLGIVIISLNLFSHLKQAKVGGFI